MIRRLWAVAKKELRQVGRDGRSLSVLLFVPAFLLVVFGYAVSLDVRQVPLLALDLDRTAESRRLVDAFTVTEYFREAAASERPRAVDSMLGGDRARLALMIPRGYGDDRVGGRRPEIGVIVDGTNASSAAAILGYASGITEAHSRPPLHTGSAPAAAPSASRGPLVELRPRLFYNPELSSAVYLVPGLVSLILLITGVISTALTIVREKERGTMEQVLVSPLRPIELILGKTLPYMAIALLSASAVLSAGVALFHVPVRGSLLALLLVTILYLASCLGIGLVISTVAATQQVAFMISIMSMLLPSFVLSGFVFPIRNMPLPIQLLTFLWPSRYYLEAIRDILLKGTGVRAYWGDLLGLVLVAGLTLTAGTVRLARRSL